MWTRALLEFRSNEVPEFYHLAQLVKPVKVYTHRVESWTALVSRCSGKIAHYVTNVFS